METIPPEQQRAQEQAEKEARLQYADTLAGPDDYWISITDAARITRTSEAMARRWVTSGRLPIRREMVGMNQRTRMVRASDLQQIRPIIDPSAAITDDVRKLDLVSIPRQQQQLADEQQRIEQQLEEVRQAQTQTHDLAQATSTALGEYIAEQRGVNDALQHQFSSMQAHYEQQLGTIANTAEQQGEQMEQFAQAVEQLRQALEKQRGLYQAAEDLMEKLANRVEQTTSAVKSLAEAAAETQSSAERKIQQLEQHVGGLHGELQTLSRDQARDVATLTGQFEGISPLLERVLAQSQEAQRGATQKIGQLEEALRQEREAREALAAQVITLLQRKPPTRPRPRKSDTGQINN